ncbi:MAG: hypothetical protein ACOYNC_01530 [Bacteroidales bacterium]
MRTLQNKVTRILLRTILRFNPLFKPIIPSQLTIYLLAVIFTFLFFRDQILCTFIVEYKQIALSAWGFLLLINFLEALMEIINEDTNKE